MRTHRARALGLAAITTVMAALWGGNRPTAAFDDATAIAVTKGTDAAKIDPGLPHGVAFEEWLKRVMGPGATFEWEVNDCGEPCEGCDDEKGPTCVGVDARLPQCPEVVIYIAIDDREDKPVAGGVFLSSFESLTRTVENDFSVPQLADALRTARAERPTFELSPISDTAAVSYAKSLKVERLAPGFGFDGTLEELLASVATQGSTTWELNNCGETLGLPRPDECREIHACVSAKTALPDGSKLYSGLRVGTWQRGIRGAPAWKGISRRRGNDWRRLENLSQLKQDLAASIP